MTLDFLLKAFRKLLQKSAGQNQLECNDESQKDQERQKDKSDDVAKYKLYSTTETADDDSIDPFNPFPDPVVIEFRDVLDLHSIPPKLVRAVVEDYLEEAHTRGVPYLRIIHGKGIGVQRELVRSILASKPFVTDFQDAPIEAGGWGATIVNLGEKKMA
jgi:hypothetical protein